MGGSGSDGGGGGGGVEGRTRKPTTRVPTVRERERERGESSRTHTLANRRANLARTRVPLTGDGVRLPIVRARPSRFILLLATRPVLCQFRASVEAVGHLTRTPVSRVIHYLGIRALPRRGDNCGHSDRGPLITSTAPILPGPLSRDGGHREASTDH
jgi:hypothetical protein